MPSLVNALHLSTSVETTFDLSLQSLTEVMKKALRTLSDDFDVFTLATIELYMQPIPIDFQMHSLVFVKNVCTYIHSHTHTHTLTHTLTYTLTHALTYIHSHTNTQVSIYTHTYRQLCTHIYLSSY